MHALGEGLFEEIDRLRAEKAQAVAEATEMRAYAAVLLAEIQRLRGVILGPADVVAREALVLRHEPICADATSTLRPSACRRI